MSRVYKEPFLFEAAGLAIEGQLLVTYSITPAFAGSRIDPPHDAGIEFEGFELLLEDGTKRPLPDWIEEMLQDSDDLKNSLFEDEADYREAVLEARAEAMREERMLEKFFG